jgi:hypothetical protein
MNRIFNQVLTIFVFFYSVNFFSQDVVWTNVLAGHNEEYGNSICLDSNSNVIITGSFQGLCYGSNFGLFSAGSNDVFVQKLSPDGVVLWTNQYGGVNSDNGHSVVTDSFGNIYVAGTFLGTVYFGASTLNSAVVNGNFFVLKLDPDGNVVWRKSIPGYNNHRPKLTVDQSNNLFLTGHFDGTRTFGNSVLNSLDGAAFVSKLNSDNGNLIWITQFGSGSTLNGNPVPVNITTSNFTTDTLGNIFITGCFRGHGRFGNQNVLIQNSDSNAYIMKMSSSGSILWTKFYTGSTEGTSIVSDDNNNIYLAGNYFGQVTINGNSYTAPSGFYSIYLEKLDSNGNLIWFKNYDLNATQHFDVLPQLAIDGNANLFFSCGFGNFSNTDTISFENHTFKDIVSTQPNILKPQLLASFNSDGDNLWVNQYEKLSDSRQFGIFADKTKNIAVNENGLYFTSGNSKFNNITYSSHSGANIFVAKLALPFSLNNDTFESDPKIMLYPNPTTGKVNIDFLKNYSYVEIHVFNFLGQLIDTKQFNNISIASFDLAHGLGAYFLVIKLNNKREIKKVIKF